MAEIKLGNIMGPQGPQGNDGLTPHIGANGNWWIGSNDTKIKAQGPIGDKPAHNWQGTNLQFQNPDGSFGAYVDLKGEQGAQGKQGIQGEQGPIGIPGGIQNGIELLNESIPFYSGGSFSGPSPDLEQYLDVPEGVEIDWEKDCIAVALSHPGGPLNISISRNPRSVVLPSTGQNKTIIIQPDTEFGDGKTLRYTYVWLLKNQIDDHTNPWCLTTMEITVGYDQGYFIKIITLVDGYSLAHYDDSVNCPPTQLFGNSNFQPNFQGYLHSVKLIKGGLGTRFGGGII